jgi:hypothetical protein
LVFSATLFYASEEKLFILVDFEINNFLSTHQISVAQSVGQIRIACKLLSKKMQIGIRARDFLVFRKSPKV